MMRFTVEENKGIARDVYRMILAGDAGGFARPGQFAQIAVPGFYLRRPISVCDWDEDRFTIVYKVVGGGTLRMSRIAPGEELDALTGLGNGFDMSRCESGTLLIGGGVGAPPLYGLCKRLMALGKPPVVLLGFESAEDAMLINDFRALGARMLISTLDGSLGVKGLVTDLMRGESARYACACGPRAMLRAVHDICPEGQFSFEERMGCGFGACMGCSCKTKHGSKRICKDGPVLEGGEIVW